MNIRIYTRSFQKILVEDNPIIRIMIEFKKSLEGYFFLSRKSKELSKNIFEERNKFLKTKKIITINSKKNNINLIR